MVAAVPLHSEMHVAFSLLAHLLCPDHWRLVEAHPAMADESSTSSAERSPIPAAMLQQYARVAGHPHANPLRMTLRTKPPDEAMLSGNVDLTFLFDPNYAFNPHTGLRYRVHYVSSRPQDAIRDIQRYADWPGSARHPALGHFWGPAGTVGTGVIAIAFGGPIGWVAGVATLAVGFSWAINDIAQWLDEIRADRDKANSSGQHVDVTDEEVEENWVEEGDDSQEQESDVTFTDEEVAEDLVAAGGRYSPDSDQGLGAGSLPPGVLRLIGPGAASYDPGRWGNLPNPEGGGPQGPASHASWLVMPLYLPNPEGGGPQGPASLLDHEPVAGFVAFYKAASRA